MSSISLIFGSMVFSDSVMKERLPKETYKALQRTIRDGRRLDATLASIVAATMKDWAIEKGATHFTHWFQPMTGITAEKHDSFISPLGDGRVIMEFSGKELTQGESDASSFPSGGLRATFEARGYTAWDPTAYAFVKDGVLCIPTAFCSYGGEALDKKTPLLRSMEALSKQALRILKLFGNIDAMWVRPTVGAEQEYFLIDRDMFDRRKDLIYTGRTLFGAMPPKGQELEDHYFGAVKPRVAAFMKELNEQLWMLGIPAKTEHNEAAPGQHELAPVFETANIAADHNQLTMEMMQKIAKKHGMACLLHEKPFEGVNGSGKHNNWALTTNMGDNLLEPGETPYENAQFLLFLCAVIKAVDEYQDLLRISVASGGNDHRLGGNEAPPAIVSIFIGTELMDVLESIESGSAYGKREKEQLKIGVHALPRLPKDSTDRNRTSPFAFTGNKFEFRMPGSFAPISDPNIIINTAVAEQLRQFADELEAKEDFENALNSLIRKVIAGHKRILFNGNGYDDAWNQEAESRGLLNLRSTPECLPYLISEKNIRLFASHKVFSETEVRARHDVILEGYCKVLNIEALTMAEMSMKDILPAISAYSRSLAETITEKRRACAEADCTYEQSVLKRLSELSGEAHAVTGELSREIENVKGINDIEQAAMYYRSVIFELMGKLRGCVDEAETMTAESYWPYPSCGELMFSVK